MNIDHLDALAALETAYHLLTDAYVRMPDDEPIRTALDRWLTWYEKMDLVVPDIEGVPV